MASLTTFLKYALPIVVVWLFECWLFMNWILRSPLVKLRKMPPVRYLLALDFDHTVVDENTDIVAKNLLKPDEIPENVKKLYKSNDWISFMQEVFKLLHKNKFDREAILGAITSIRPVSGFEEFIKKTKERGDVDIIIISDSNSEFIGNWLKCKGLQNCIEKVFTNPAEFNEEGLLTIQPFQHQTTCSLSSINMCKGQILDEYRGEKYSNCIYVGDGQNDVCPMLRLSEKDLICPRTGYSAEKILANMKNELKAPIFPWTNGYDLLFKATKLFKQDC